MFNKRRLTTLLSALLVLACAPASAADRWVAKGGPDAYVRGIRVFSNTPAAGQTTLIVASQTSGMLKVIDDGTGTPAATSINTGIPTLRLRSLSASTTAAIYAATDGFGVYKSTDFGATWAPANGAGATKLGCHYVRNLAARSDTDVWAVTACRYNSGVYRSQDGGATWSRIGTATIPDDLAGGSLTFNSAGTTIALATGRDGVFRSTDSGATWAQVNNGLPAPGGPNRLSVFNVQCRATCTELLAYVEGHGVYLTTDGGANWALSSTGLPPSAVAHAGIQRESSTVFYLGISKGPVFKTTDGGANWAIWGNTGTTEESSFVRSVANDASGRYYLGSVNGLARTTSAATSFDTITMPMTGVSSQSLASDDTTLVVAAATIYRIPDIHGSLDLASAIDAGLPGGSHGGTVRVDPGNSQVIYAALQNFGVYKTLNGGAAWTHLGALPSGAHADAKIRIERTNPQVVWAGFSNPLEMASGGGIYRSPDGGSTWTPKNTGLSGAAARDIRCIDTHEVATTTVFAATDDGLYRSTDSGDTWSKVWGGTDGGGKPLPVGWVIRHPANPAIVYMATEQTEPDGTVLATSGVLKSTNGGDNWTVVLSNKRADQVTVLADGTVFAGLRRDLTQPALLRSRDGGASWQPYAAGFFDGDFQSMVRSFDYTRLVDAVTNTGIYTLARNTDTDFNADGKPDIVWSNITSGATYVWRMNGPTLISDSFYATIDPSWKIQGIADFNADGHPDVVWRNTANGTCYVWYTINGVFTGTDAFLFSLPPEWVIQGVADFNQDGRPDFLMRNTVSGNAFAWYFNDNVPIGDQFLFNIDPSWKVEAVGDISLDGQPDLLFRSMSSGLSFAWNTVYAGGVLSLGASSPMIYSIDPVWEVVQLEDWNGDGNPDLLFRNASTGLVFVWYLNGVVLGGSDFVIQIDPSWEIVPRR